MAKYVQDRRTGRMAGSIGDGKTSIPQPSSIPLFGDAPAQSEDQDRYAILASAFEAFREELDSDRLEDQAVAPRDLNDPPAEPVFVQASAPGVAAVAPAPYSFRSYSQFSGAVLESVGELLVNAPENSFERSGIASVHERSGSKTFEEDFAIPFLTNPGNQERFKEVISRALPDSEFEFIRFRAPLENTDDPNQNPAIADEVSDNPYVQALVDRLRSNESGQPQNKSKRERAWADLFIVARHNGRLVYLPINIKCSEGTASWDNTGGWPAASFALFGQSRTATSRESFYKAIAEGKISADAPTDYFFWTFTKGDPQVGDRLTTGFSYASFLEFPDPEHRVFKFNRAQSFPLQVDTANAAQARKQISERTPKSEMSLLARRRRFARMIVKPANENAVKEVETTGEALAALDRPHPRRIRIESPVGN